MVNLVLKRDGMIASLLAEIPAGQRNKVMRKALAQYFWDTVPASQRPAMEGRLIEDLGFKEAEAVKIAK